MRADKLISVSISTFLLLLVLAFFAADGQAAGDSPGEGKRLGVALTGEPAALHKVLIGFSALPGKEEEAIVAGAGGRIKYTYRLVPAIAATVPEAAIEGLLRNPRVTHIDKDVSVRALDPELDAAWGVKRIGAGTVHEPPLNNKGGGVKVAVIDSGIDYTHPDLNANYAGGKNFLKNDFINILYCGGYSENDPMDDNGHGTHVSGTVAAEDDSFGVVGVAPLARLYALKVLNCLGMGDFSDVIAALQWSVDNGMQVTNNSYGSDEDPGLTVKQAFDNAYNAGVLHVAAAGNSGTVDTSANNVGYPARYDSVMAVAATDTTDARAGFSSTGPAVELAAPGVGIYSTCAPYSLLCMFGEYYTALDGTSMASPHVAGAAALVIASGTSDLNGDGRINDEVRQRLVGTADDLGAAGRDSLYGFGLVNAYAAVTASVPIPPANTPPVAVGDSYGTSEDTALAVPAVSGVLANDTDADADPLTARLVSGPGHGTLTLNADGSFSYVPAANFYGSDSFTYRANDGAADSNLATVAISVTSVNDSPVAVNDSATTRRNRAVVINVVANDYDLDGTVDPASVTIKTFPSHGTAVKSVGSGTVTYTPSPGFRGTDTFSYDAKDNSGATSNLATVTVKIR